MPKVACSVLSLATVLSATMIITGCDSSGELSKDALKTQTQDIRDSANKQDAAATALLKGKGGKAGAKPTLKSIKGNIGGQ
jgi:hypothetical protein